MCTRSERETAVPRTLLSPSWAAITAERSIFPHHQAAHHRGVNREHDDPSSPVMKHVIEDAMNPGRREAIRSAFEDLQEVGEEPLQHHVRTSRPGEEITGTVLGHDHRIASLGTARGIVVADRADLPERLPDDEKITFTARSDFSRVRREQPAQEAQSQAAPSRQPQQDHNPELKAIEAQIAAQRSREARRRSRAVTCPPALQHAGAIRERGADVCALPLSWVI